MRTALRVATGVLLLLSACTEREDILPGERQAIRGTDPGLLIAAVDADAAPPLTLPAARRLPDWPLRVGNARNDPGHATLSAAPTRLWSASVGQGDTRRQRIAADPVSDGARIFTMDARSGVVATSVQGATLWRRSLVPTSERETDAAGGGLAVADGTVFATTGYGNLHALDAETGAELWIQRLDAPVTSPKPAGGLVYLVSRDARAFAIDARTGRIRWELPAAAAASVMATAPAPAVTDRLAILPFGSGELLAALRQSGLRVWGTSVSGRRRGVAYNGQDDITGDPVVADGAVYAGTTAGRIVALDLRDGTRRWTLTEGAISPLAVAGGSVFAVTDRAQLLRVDAATGAVLWRRDLPFWTRARVARREGVYVHHGPVLAGGRLWIASSDGAMRAFDPASGAPAGALDVPGGAASRPIAFGDALYVVGRKGQLHAYR